MTLAHATVELREAAKKARAAEDALAQDDGADDAATERAMDARDEALAEFRRHLYPERLLALLDRLERAEKVSKAAAAVRKTFDGDDDGPGAQTPADCIAWVFERDRVPARDAWLSLRAALDDEAPR